jgi:hypothetical protein
LTTPSRPQPRRTAVGVLVVLATCVLSLAAAGSALAGSSCGDKVIDDWYDGRIDGTYPLPCYDDAIKQLPRDLRDYSSAPEDIKRALQAAKRGEPAPPNKDPVPTDERPDPTPPVTTSGDDPPPTTPGPNGDPGPVDTVASPADTGSARSVPIPLLVLAGLALLLILGGSAGYIVRRFQARRLPPPV